MRPVRTASVRFLVDRIDALLNEVHVANPHSRGNLRLSVAYEVERLHSVLDHVAQKHIPEAQRDAVRVRLAGLVADTLRD